MSPAPALRQPAEPAPDVSWGLPVLLGAVAGGMGWGIRGQYGHETGAMMAGLLTACAVCFALAGALGSARVIRAIAWATVGMGIGGSMTYGQTVGLTHNPDMVGNGAALAWGMLGLGIKGAIWIGFGAVFLGMGLGGVRYRGRELVLLYLGLLAACALGIWLLNEPHDPANRRLPRIYFSADWRWTPDATPERLKPRREVWGGLLLALTLLLVWLGVWRKDRVAWRLGLWGCLGGAVGFPLGQSLQAFHAWNRELFASGAWAEADRVINWWNFMETTFGLTMGAAIGLGAWTMRRWITDAGQVAEAEEGGALPASGWLEGGLLAVHAVLLVGVEFAGVRWIDAVYDFGLMLAFIPFIGVGIGRVWPWVLTFGITLVPIAGKTFRNLCVEEKVLAAEAGVALYLVVPMVASGVVGWRLWRRARAGGPSRSWLGAMLVFQALLYFGLNQAFFRLPWPWLPWTARTPNSLVYAACVAVLAGAVWVSRRRRTRSG